MARQTFFSPVLIFFSLSNKNRSSLQDGSVNKFILREPCELREFATPYRGEQIKHNELDFQRVRVEDCLLILRK